MSCCTSFTMPTHLGTPKVAQTLLPTVLLGDGRPADCATAALEGIIGTLRPLARRLRLSCTSPMDDVGHAMRAEVLIIGCFKVALAVWAARTGMQQDKDAIRGSGESANLCFEGPNTSQDVLQVYGQKAFLAASDSPSLDYVIAKFARASAQRTWYWCVRSLLTAQQEKCPWLGQMLHPMKSIALGNVSFLLWSAANSYCHVHTSSSTKKVKRNLREKNRMIPLPLHDIISQQQLRSNNELTLSKLSWLSAPSRCRKAASTHCMEQKAD